MKELQARHDYPVAVLCSALGVSRSGYYAWCERPASARQRDDERLKVAIRGVHAASRQTYGTRRVLVELRAQGFEAGRDRVDRLRRTMALRCRQKRCFRVTTDSEHTLPVADNLLQQDFTASAPDQLWLTDITYIRTDEGWLYLAGITARKLDGVPIRRVSRPSSAAPSTGSAKVSQAEQQEIIREAFAR